MPRTFSISLVSQNFIRETLSETIKSLRGKPPIIMGTHMNLKIEYGRDQGNTILF